MNRSSLLILIFSILVINETQCMKFGGGRAQDDSSEEESESTPNQTALANIPQSMDMELDEYSVTKIQNNLASIMSSQRTRIRITGNNNSFVELDELQTYLWKRELLNTLQSTVILKRDNETWIYTELNNLPHLINLTQGINTHTQKIAIQQLSLLGQALY